MGREIKFRAWDNERKEMRQVQLMDWSDWWVSTGHTWERGKKPLEFGERNSFKNARTDRHILMQYTGLKANGKEIYEGDILLYIASNMSDMVVKFVDGCFVGEGPYITYSLIEYINAQDFESIEIIGNIYENPELLG